MRTIVVANSKGGSGKSTLAMNLAAYFACWGIRVTLVDFDRQRSALDWLAVRPPERPEIRAVHGDRHGFRAPPESDYAILDVPSNWGGDELDPLLGASDAVVVPVLPSPLDMRASGRFLAELLQALRARAHPPHLCVVANRVRENTLAYKALERFLAQAEVPFIARLRETQNYVHAAEQGLGIFELPRRQVEKDLEQWQPLVAWLAGDPRLTPVPPLAGDGPA